MDPESSQSGGIIGLLTWFEEHKKHVAIGGGFIVVALFIGMIIVQQQARKEQAASEALSDVRGLLTAAASPAGTIEALSKVASGHEGTKAAARALLISAGLMFSEAKSSADYAEAEKRFTQITREYSDSAWLPQAHLGIAASLAAQGKTAEATTKYEEINRRYANAPIFDQSRLSLAKLYEASKPEDAFKLYEELIKAHPGGQGSVSAMEAAMRQDDMLKAKPELAKLKAALNPPPPPPISPNQPVQITPMTNRVVPAMTNSPRVLMTNRPGTSQPVQIKLNPTPSPGAANPTPAPPK